MKLSKYLQDKMPELCLIFFANFVVCMLLIAFKLPPLTIIVVLSVEFIFYSFAITIDFLRKKSFYGKLLKNLALLDKKFLILETLPSPTTNEAELLYEILYEIDSSMAEQVSEFSKETNDFKEYIEMWLHEVKIPIASLTLMTHNHKTKMSPSYLKELRRLDNYVEQVLYYVRSNHTEQDFIIKKVHIEKIINEVALKNKDDLLENEITFQVDCHGVSIHTDAKWLEFIINQIVNNSIKYKKSRDSYIKIYTTTERDKTLLHILDNGIGIPEQDLKNVFNKTFTGENGRIKTKSTGMGLYIAKKLCDKLGVKISIESDRGEYTEVTLAFGKDDFYEM